MKPVFAAALMLASFGDASAAEDVTSNVDGTLTVHFAPPAAKKNLTRAQKCNVAWNEALQAAQLNSEKDFKWSFFSKPKYNRLHYRNCFYQCFDPGWKPPESSASGNSEWSCPFVLTIAD